jgi:myo-inositol-1(or 4)-monophosphatase
MTQPRMTPEDASAYTELACRLAALGGQKILPFFRAQIDIDNKAAGAGWDPVTEADREAEKVMRAEIHRLHPSHGILGEEHGHHEGQASWTWVIDPIDGTRAFILGQLHWGTLIALNDGRSAVVGVMHQPYVEETFVGSPAGAELRRRGEVHRLHTRRCASLKEAVVCATHPDVFRTRAERAAFDLVASRARQLRWGGDCYNYCLLAAGLVDVVIESSLLPYDVQAIVPIIRGAGGVITTWSGGPAESGGQIVACGDPGLHAQILPVLSAAAE